MSIPVQRPADLALWERHRHGIIDAMRSAPVSTLKVIAEIIGYDIETWKVVEKPVAPSMVAADGTTFAQSSGETTFGGRPRTGVRVPMGDPATEAARVPMATTIDLARQSILQALIDMPIDRKDNRKIVGRDVCRTGPTTWFDMDTGEEGDAGWMIDLILAPDLPRPLRKVAPPSVVATVEEHRAAILAEVKLANGWPLPRALRRDVCVRLGRQRYHDVSYQEALALLRLTDAQWEGLSNAIEKGIGIGHRIGNVLVERGLGSFSKLRVGETFYVNRAGRERHALGRGPR